MGQRASKPGAPGGADGEAAPDGYGVAVVREDGKWRCTAMHRAALTSLAAAETELRELRSAGAVFGLIYIGDDDYDFFIIVRPAPAGTLLLLSDATAALDFDIASEALEHLDAEIDDDELEDSDPFEAGDLAVLSDIGLHEDVLRAILSDSDYADEQLIGIARQLGFDEEMAAVTDKLDR
jgi:putative tRNA adenosine deaminase-associated protein